jgi:modulator of FtsH protease HflC
MRKAKALFICSVIAALLCSFDIFYIVDEGEQAVITQLGESVYAVTEPGLHVKAPFIQKAIYFDDRFLGWKKDGFEIATADHMSMRVEISAWWRITRPVAFLKNLGSYQKAYARLDDVIPSAVKDQALKCALAELVRPSPVLKTLEGEGMNIPAIPSEAIKITRGRDEVMLAVREDVSRGLAGQGIELGEVRMKELVFGQKFSSLVYQRMVSERKARAEALRSEGEGKRAEIAGLMEKELKALSSEAFKTSEEIRGKADAEATRIYGSAYNQDPEFYSFLKTLETYKNTPFENTTLILGTDSDFYKLLKGPSK